MYKYKRDSLGIEDKLFEIDDIDRAYFHPYTKQPYSTILSEITKKLKNEGLFKNRVCSIRGEGYHSPARKYAEFYTGADEGWLNVTFEIRRGRRFQQPKLLGMGRYRATIESSKDHPTRPTVKLKDISVFVNEETLTDIRRFC